MPISMPKQQSMTSLSAILSIAQERMLINRKQGEVEMFPGLCILHALRPNF